MQITAKQLLFMELTALPYQNASEAQPEPERKPSQCLTDEQEEVLIGCINSLTDRGMPPTSQIVRNLAEEIRGSKVGKNWVGQL